MRPIFDHALQNEKVSAPVIYHYILCLFNA